MHFQIITDISFCRYLYTTHVEVDNSNVFDLLHAAIELKLEDLQSKCSLFLQGKINKNNFVMYAKAAVNFGTKYYIDIVQEYFSQNTSRLLKREDLFECSQEVISALCGSKEINCSELELFYFAMEWARRRCQKNKTEETPENLRDYLEDIIEKIRFGSMDMSEFRTAVVTTKVLTKEEIGHIIMEKGTEDTRNVDQDLISNFSSQTSVVLKSDEFKRLSSSTLQKLYSTDNIGCKELDLFLAALDWANVNKPNKQDFQRILNNIRFPVMPVEDFMANVVPAKILTYEQIGQIIFQMQTKDRVSPYSDECREKMQKVCILSSFSNLIFI